MIENSKQENIKSSDAKSWLSCERRVWYDNYPPEDKREIELFDQLIIDRSAEHREAVYHRLSKQYTIERAQSPKHTRDLMEKGVQVIYEPQLLDSSRNLLGTPDFLIRHEDGEYQPADARIIKSTKIITKGDKSDKDKKEIQIQFGIYQQLLGTNLPGLVYLGHGEIEEVHDPDDKLVGKFLNEMNEILAETGPPSSARYAHSICKTCPYYSICYPQFIDEGEITLVYGIDRRSAPKLEEIDIDTFQKLLASQPDDIPKIPYLTNNEKAVLQAKSWHTGEIFKLNDIELPKGTWVHFDIEDNPLDLSGEKHVYLWGFLVPDYDEDAFEYSWTDNMDDDLKGWLEFITLVEEYKNKYTDLIIAHYSHHEYTTIKKYAERYDMLEHPIVAWLLDKKNGPLFDLHKSVIDNVILPLHGYGLKDICKHEKIVNFQWENEESGSQWSVVQFNKFQKEEDPVKREKLKKEILGYNRDDVRATRALEEWIREFNK